MTQRRYDLLESIGTDRGAKVDRRTGFLHAQVRPTRTGIMVYRHADGSVTRELKHPDDVFDPASLATLERIVITRGHPRDSNGKPLDLTTKTVKELQVGHGGSRIARERVGDEEHPIVDATVTDASVVADITRKDAPLDQVSLGYSVEVIDESGVWNGQPYDKRHKNIRYDHLAVALQHGGRGGSTVNFVLDEADGVLVHDDDPQPQQQQRKDDDTMGNIRITLDEVGLDIDPTAWSILSPLVAKRDAAIKSHASTIATLTDEKTKLEAARDQALKTAADEKKRADEAEAKAKAPREIKPILQTLQKGRRIVELDEKAVDAILGDADPIAATHRAVVLLACADEADALKGKSPAYFEARFDALASTSQRRDSTEPVAGALQQARPAPRVDEKVLEDALYPDKDPLSYLDTRDYASRERAGA